MVLPSRSEAAGRELARRLAEFRNELHSLGDSPTRAAIERLLARVVELGLRDDEVSDEVAELRACLAALELKAGLARSELAPIGADEAMARAESCYFRTPVRFGRRRADQLGSLAMSPNGLTFRGALDVRVVWSEIAAVRRSGCEILILLQDSTRVLRFCCGSREDAARGGVIAEHLADNALAGTSLSRNGCHVSA